MFVNMNLFREIFQKAGDSNPLHVEYVTVTRNGKTFVQRYRKKTPKLDIPNTPLNSALIDKVYHSYYHDGESYEANGKKIYFTNPEHKEAAKKLKTREFQDSLTDAYIHNIELMGGDEVPEDEKMKIKKEIYQKEREKFKNEVLPKIEERKFKLDKKLEQNLTRWTNQYTEAYSKDKIIDYVQREADKINESSTYKDMDSFLQVVKFKLGDAADNNQITFSFKGKEHVDTLGNLRKRIESKKFDSNTTKFSKMGIKDLRLLDLQQIPDEKLPYKKTLEEYLESRVKEIDEKMK